ncbi:MAG TPA: hypothetical protein VJN71_02125 [Nitrososphaerales archaeon]|nr:hypothetical protein [Nitrososphaerales archaeon]
MPINNRSEQEKLKINECEQYVVETIKTWEEGPYCGAKVWDGPHDDHAPGFAVSDLKCIPKLFLIQITGKSCNRDCSTIWGEK